MFVFGVSFKSRLECKLGKALQGEAECLFSVLHDSGMVQHVQRGESKLSHCQGQGSLQT